MYIQNIVNILSDYKYYHLTYGHPITRNNVERWLDQFSFDTRKEFAEAFMRLLEKSYINKKSMKNFIITIDKKIKTVFDNNPFLYLRIQQGGDSQEDILSLITTTEQINYPYTNFVYFDDVLYSGGRAQADVTNWINNYAPQQCTLLCYFIAAYDYGRRNTIKKIYEAIKTSGKQINFIFDCEYILKNYKPTSDSQDIFHPDRIYEDLEEIKEFYENENKNARYPIALRTKKTQNSFFFDDEEQRCLLEKELTIAGIKILNKISDKKNWKPLGVEGFSSFGFGSPIITYRNCPNTAPLALWWGDQTDNNLWYPLVPRKTYSTDNNEALFL